MQRVKARNHSPLDGHVLQLSQAYADRVTPLRRFRFVIPSCKSFICVPVAAAGALRIDPKIGIDFR
ncbi:hypothetical protein [Mesorhizobium sp. ANAO-SY3R2]|uniref:hypothetical protein n=1 Tax=Mesorhizobium sp. ANAO-SY3R2 TaxID=3166644 RepID=UPI00366F9E0A